MTGTDTHIDTFNSTVSIDGIAINGIFPDSIPFPKGKTGTKDCSTLGSGTIQRKGLKTFDPGNCALSGNKIPGDAGQIALFAAFGDRKEHIITVSIPDAGELFTYSAYVSTDYPDSKDDTYIFTADLEATGPAVLGTAFATITNITTTSGTVYPTGGVPAGSGVDMISYVASGTTVTLTVTAAAASSLAYSINNGSTWITLTSAVASGAITLGAAGTMTPILIMVTEVAKATRFVNLNIIKVA